MSIIKLDPSDVEFTTLVTNPRRSYFSSSNGITGSVKLTVRNEFPTIRDVSGPTTYADGKYVDDGYRTTVQSILNKMSSYNVTPSLSTSLGTLVTTYIDSVGKLSSSLRQTKEVYINRFVPTGRVDTSFSKKLIIKDLVNPYYRSFRPHCNWAYTDYHCLSFYTASTVPTSSALLYPNVRIINGASSPATGVYDLPGAFSIEARINPRYNGFGNDPTNFKAGTIVHLSSSYALSLVTGSLKDENGKPRGFRLQLQLSRSADIVPSLASPDAGYPNDLVFRSNDNSLEWNKWHHVVVRWGTSQIDYGTGSFVVDGVVKGTFVVPSASLVLSSSTPAALCVGNFYEGTNSGLNAQALFFSADPALRHGLRQLVPTTGMNTPNNYSFNHPLNADVHQLAIHRRYLTLDDIAVSGSTGPTNVSTGSHYAFYLPPFFDENAPLQRYVGGFGGVLQTPFYELDGTTREPFNAAMSFGVLGHYINLENFVKDWANDNHPLLHHMTGVAIATTTLSSSADDFLYAQPFVRRRNTLIMPCDDGAFVPSYELLNSTAVTRERHVDDVGSTELSFISIDNLVSTASLYVGDAVLLSSGTSLFVSSVIGPTAQQPALGLGQAWSFFSSSIASKINSGLKPTVNVGPPLSVYSQTKDASSNQVVFFDVSNVFYGSRIKPKSVWIRDSAITGSGDALSMTLHDDGAGNLYRCDAKGTHPTWASVGNVYYDEGIILIKSPHLFGFGKHQHSIDLSGERPVYVVKYDVVAPAGMLNSSSNPTYVPLKPSNYVNDSDSEFVYISGINIHDENYNIIMRSKLAQPVVKRTGEQLGFRLSIDY